MDRVVWSRSDVTQDGVVLFDDVQVVVGPLNGTWQVRVWTRFGDMLVKSPITSSVRERGRLELDVDERGHWTVLKSGDCGCG